MALFKRSKKYINIVIDDHVIRIVEASSEHLENARVIVERPIPLDLVENGKIADEVQFFGFMNELVKEFSLKNRFVRFYVPNSLVIMRQIEYPSHLTSKQDITDYFSMEFGKSLHLPFKDPVFDVHYLPENASNLTDELEQFREMKTGVLFAAPREEMQRYTDIFVDANLKPVLADVNALGVFRYYQRLDRIQRNQIYMFVELNITSINLSIFNSNQLEFLRYQDLDIQLAGWNVLEETNTITWQYTEDKEMVQGIVMDQVMELGRIMNFYRFSMHQGEQQVTNIVILGDHPYKNDFYLQVKEQHDLTVELLDSFQAKDGKVDSVFIPALGLAIEGGLEA